MQREDRQISRGGRRALAIGGALALVVSASGTALADTNDPIAAKQWALSTLNITQVRDNYKAQGNGVIVAVLDSGVDPNQPDLQGRLVDGVNLTNPSSPSSDFSDRDSQSHGTAVATVIAGLPHKDSSGNYYGIIGIADDAKIMPVDVSGTGTPSDSSVIAGIKYAVSHGAQVINMSIGGPGTNPAVTSAINQALAAGVVVVVAAGNTGNEGNAANSYATVPGVLDVAGTDSNGTKYSFGHSGSDVNIAAPANSIEVGLVNSQYGELSGTSFSTPMVSGEAALLIAEHPAWTSGQIVATIVDNTMQVANHQATAGQRVSDDVGYGVIDPLAALGATEPAKTANPLGGPAITSNPAENVKNSAGASAGSSAPATGTGTNGPSPTASSKSSSSTPIIIVVVVVVVLLIALLIFLLSRRNRGGKGGPGGGGGGGNGYYTPQNPPGGQQAQPPYQQQPQQNPYPPQQGGYGQQQPQNPYSGR